MTSFLTTYTAYTEPEYQWVTSQSAYTGGGTDTYTGKSFNKLMGAIVNISISRELVRYSLSNFR